MNTSIYGDLHAELTSPYGEKYLHGVNGILFDQLDSTTIFAKKFPAIFLQETSLYVITGTDSGLFLKYILQFDIPKGTKIIFVELDEITEWIKDNQELPTIPDEVAIIPFSQLSEQLAAFEVENYIFINTLKILHSYASIDLHYIGYSSLKQNVEQTLETVHWENAVQLLNKVFIENQLKNIQDNLIHGSELYGKFQNKSAILLAGGPSLDHSISWIKEHRDHFIIIAVSRISRRLQQAEIVPDIIFSIDPHPLSFDLSREMYHFSESSLFIHAYHVYPPLIAQWPGRSAYLGPILPWDSPLNSTVQEMQGSTVTNVAMDTAIKMGFSEIILCGVDLCYSPEGVSHASYSKNDETGARIEGSDTTVETYSGFVADTTFAYKLAAKHLSSLAINAADSCKIINTSKYAAKMVGIEFQPMHEIAVSGSTDTGKKILDLFGNTSAINFRKNILSTYLLGLNKTKNTLREIISLSKKALKETDLLTKAGDKSRDHYLAKINRVEQKLNTPSKSAIIKLIKSYGVENFLKVVKYLNIIDDSHNKQWSHDEISQAFIGYYTAYHTSASALLGLLQDSCDRIQLRQEELNLIPDYSALFQGYENDHIPGRIYVCEKLLAQNNSLIPDSFKSQRQHCHNSFQGILRGEKPYVKAFTNNWGNWTVKRLNKLRSTVLKSHIKKDHGKLRKIISHLEGSSEFKPFPLLCLAQGLLYELSEQFDSAINSYQQLIEKGDSVDSLYLEDALRRIASISISKKNYENAVLAFQCLYDLSFSYAPQYARILTLTGSIDDALDIYADYLAKVPNDIETMLQLGKVYQKLNYAEGMTFAANHVLQHSPTNQSALLLLNEAEKLNSSENKDNN